MTEDNLWYLLCGVMIGLTISLQVPAIDWLPWWPYAAGVLIAWAIMSALIRWWRRKHEDD